MLLINHKTEILIEILVQLDNLKLKLCFYCTSSELFYLLCKHRRKLPAIEQITIMQTKQTIATLSDIILIYSHGLKVVYHNIKNFVIIR